MPTIGDAELDKHIQINHRNATRASETASQVTIGGGLTAQEMRQLSETASAKGWHLELVAGALVLKVGKG